MPIWQPRVVLKMLRRGKKTAKEFYENKEKKCSCGNDMSFGFLTGVRDNRSILVQAKASLLAIGAVTGLDSCTHQSKY